MQPGKSEEQARDAPWEAWVVLNGFTENYKRIITSELNIQVKWSGKITKDAQASDRDDFIKLLMGSLVRGEEVGPIRSSPGVVLGKQQLQQLLEQPQEKKVNNQRERRS